MGVGWRSPVGVHLRIVIRTQFFRMDEQNLLAEILGRRLYGARGRLGDRTRVIGSGGTMVDTFIGSEIAPQRIDVDPAFPERHFPFLVTKVPSVPSRYFPNLVFDTYHISMTLSAADATQVVLTVPTGPPSNRVLACIPTLSYWQSDMARYHAALNPGCRETREAYMDLENSIGENPERQHFYLMLVFPEDLDNIPFSNDAVSVRCQPCVMFDNPPDIGGRPLSGVGMNWRIAVYTRPSHAVANLHSDVVGQIEGAFDRHEN